MLGKLGTAYAQLRKDWKLWQIALAAIALVGPPLYMLLAGGQPGLRGALAQVLFLVGFGMAVYVGDREDKAPLYPRGKLEADSNRPNPAPAGAFGVRCDNCSGEQYACEHYTYRYGRPRSSSGVEVSGSSAGANICALCIFSERIRKINEAGWYMWSAAGVGLAALVALILSLTNSGLEGGPMVCGSFLALGMLLGLGFTGFLVHESVVGRRSALSDSDHAIGEPVALKLVTERLKADGWSTVWNEKEFAEWRNSPAGRPGLFEAAVTVESGGSLDTAAKMYAAVIASDPHHVMAHVGLAAILNVRGQHDDAAVRCQRALQLDPNCGKAHGVMGAIYFAQDQPMLAMMEWMRGAELGDASSADMLRRITGR